MTRKFRAVLTEVCERHGEHQVRIYSSGDCLALLLADRLADDLRARGYANELVTQYRAGDGYWHNISLADAIADDVAHGVEG